MESAQERESAASLPTDTNSSIGAESIPPGLGEEIPHHSLMDTAASATAKKATVAESRSEDSPEQKVDKVESPAATTAVEPVPEPIASTSQTTENSRKRKLETTEADGGDSKRRISCHRCGGAGHIARFCSTPHLQSDGLTCFKCKGKGHFARDCPNMLQDMCYNCGFFGHHSLDCRAPPRMNHFGTGTPGAYHSNSQPSGVSGAQQYDGGTVRGSESESAYPTSAYSTSYASYGAGYGGMNPYGTGSDYAAAAAAAAYGGPYGGPYGHHIGYSAAGPGYGQRAFGGAGVGGGGGGGAGGSNACYRCSQPGHLARECPLTGGPNCYSCGDPSHKAKDCPMSLANQTATCYRCGQHGHFSRDCTHNGAMVGRDACYKCGQLGHKSKDCAGVDIRVCFICRSTGHVSKECTNRPSRSVA